MKGKFLFKKNDFIMSTVILFSIILEILFFMLFSNIIGEYGSVLYGYAYFICFFFLGIMQIGILFSISRLINDYNTCGYYKTKRKVFQFVKKYLWIGNFFLFLIFFFFAKGIASWLVGNFADDIVIRDLTNVFRFTSLSFLIFPIINIHRGYLLGNRCIKIVIHSMILENVIQFLLLVVSPFLTNQILHLSYTITVGIASLSITITSLFIYLYLFYQERKYYQEIEKETMRVVEPNLNLQNIVKQVILSFLPFVLISFFLFISLFIDARLLIKVLVDEYFYLPQQAQSIISMIYVWGPSINIILLFLFFVVIAWLIPSFFEELKLLWEKPLEEKVNFLLQVIFYFTIPLSFILSILSKSIFTVIYDVSEFGATVYSCYVFIFPAILFFIFGILTLILLKKYRKIIQYLIVIFILKVLLNIPFVSAFSHLGFPPYYGFIVSTILSYTVFGFLVLHLLHKNYLINYEDTIKRGFSILLTTFITIIILLGIQYFLPSLSSNKILHLFYIIVFILLGNFIYFLISIYSGLTTSIFGSQFTLAIKRFFLGKK